MAHDTFTIGIGSGTKGDSLLATEEAIHQAKKSIPHENIDLAIVFATTEFSRSHTLALINNTLPDVPLIGCSSAAVISNKGILTHGIAIMLIGLPQGAYLNTSFIQNIKDKSTRTAGAELGEQLLYGFKGIRRDFGILFSDGLMTDSTGLLFGLQERLGVSFPLIGASASDNFRFLKTSVYHNQELASDAACAAIWGGKLSFGLGIKHGWKPLGKPREVTESVGNVVYEIDGASATNVYEEYFACDLARLKKDSRLISILYPIGIRLAGEEEFLLRNILSIEDNGSLVLQGDIPQGSLIRLMIGTKESCLLATQMALEDVKRGLQGKRANLVLVFDSISRYTLLGRNAAKELEIIKSAFGNNTPILGLYTYGEQAPLTATNYMGKTYFHNQTITILAIGD